MNAHKILTNFSLICLAFVVIPTHAQASGPELAVSGAVSSHSTAVGNTVEFWITLQNRGKDDISAIRVIRTPAGYSVEQLCAWDSGQAASCNDQRFGLQSVLEQVLAPGQTLAVSGQLKADTPHESETLPIVIAWKGSPNMVESSTVVSLGNNEVRTWSQRASSMAIEVGKSLAIPAALAIFGFFLNNLSKKRDALRAETERKLEEQRAADEKQREEIRHESERKRSLRSETWKQMLPISHNYAAKYYLPVSSAAERAVQDFSKSNFSLAFFYFLMVLRRMTATTDEIGGFYFKDLRGERLAAKCIKEFRRKFLGEETDLFSLAMKESADLLEPNGTYEKFKKEFSTVPGGKFNQAALQEAWMLFEKVRLDNARMNETILYLTAFYTILDYESNRPYEYWYDSGAQVAVGLEIERLLRKTAAELQFGSQETDAYLTQMKK